MSSGATWRLSCVFSSIPGFCSLSRISGRDGEFRRLLGMVFAFYMYMILPLLHALFFYSFLLFVSS